MSRALRDGIGYSLAHHAQATLSAAAGLIVRLWVPPAAFGATALTMGVQEYFRSCDALYRNAIEREVPIHLGRGETAEAEEVVGTTYLLLLLSVFGESAILIIIGALAEQPLLKLAWWTQAVVNVLEGLNATDRMLLKSTLRFPEHNRAVVVGGVLSALALIGFSWAGGTEGYFAGLVVAALLLFGVLRPAVSRAYPVVLLRRHRWLVARRVLMLGGLFASLKLLQQFIYTADRYFVAHHLGLRELGFYSFGLMLGARVYGLPQTLVGSYAPRFNMRIGAGDLEGARTAAGKLHHCTAVVSAVLAGAAMLLVEPVVTWFLPAYVGAIPAIELLLLGAYFVGMNSTSFQVHVGLKRVWRAIVIALVGLAMSIVLASLLVRQGLVGVATARVIAIGTYVAAMDWSAGRLLGIPGMRLHLVTGALFPSTVYLLLRAGAEPLAWAWVIAYSLAGAAWLKHSLELSWRELLRPRRPADDRARPVRPVTPEDA